MPTIPWRKQNNGRWAITDRMFVSLLWTGALIEFSQVGAGFIDGLVISRFLGPEAMAAQGLAQPIYSLLGVLSGLLAVGMQVRCSQALGRGDRAALSRFFSLSLLVGAALSLAVTAALLLFTRPFAALLGASGKAAALLIPVADYLRGVALGIPALIAAAILAPAIQLDSGRKTVQTGALLGSAVNVVLDLLAVWLHLGLWGVGLATAVGSYANLLYQCGHFRRPNRMLHLVRPRIGLGEFASMLACGSEVAIKRAANIVRPVILNGIIIAYGGTAAMSALAVRNNFSDFTEILGAGIAAAVSLLTGLYFGEVNEEGVEEVYACRNRAIVCLCGAVCLLVLVLARPLARLYVREEGEIFRMVVFAMRMLALQTPLQALIASRVKYLQATGRRLNMNLLILAAKLVLVLISAGVLGRAFGVWGILACYTVSDALCLLAVLVCCALRCRHLPTRRDLLALPAAFHIGPGDLISLDIRHLAEASLASEQVMLFCRGHRTDPRLAYYAALCVEELTANIVSHGFPLCRAARPLIDLRVVISGGTLTVRIQDNCPAYDVTAHFAAANAPDADKTRNIGVRIVSRMAEDIRYLHSFETNHIIMRFRCRETGKSREEQ